MNVISGARWLRAKCTDSDSIASFSADSLGQSTLTVCLMNMPYFPDNRADTFP